MTVIGDFATKQKAFNERLGTAIGGLTDDIAALNKKIGELQRTTGNMTPENEALLDELQAQGEAMATKLEALDALTPPAPPVG